MTPPKWLLRHRGNRVGSNMEQKEERWERKEAGEEINVR